MPGADMLPAPGAGVSALLAHAVGGVLADGEGAPRLRWRLAGEGYDDARMVAGRIVGIGEGVELRFSLPGEQVDLLLLEPAALPGRYRVTGIDACVITAGWLTRLSTPPSDSARVNSRRRSQNRCAPA